jgi:hypothetical protein
MKYDLVGVNDNAFSVMGYVINAMKREGRITDEIDSYRKSVMSGDYNNLLAVSVDMVDSLNENALEEEY